MNNLSKEFELLLGHAAFRLWPDLPRDMQERLFEAAVPDNPLLRYSFAVFLHDHHPRTAHPPKPTNSAWELGRHKRIAARRIRQRLAFFPQLHEIECDFDTLLGYVGCNLFEIRFGLGGNDNDHFRLALALSFDSRRSNTWDVDLTRPASASATPRAIEASRAASRVSRS